MSQQKKVYVRRTVHKESWRTIAPQIRNLEGKQLKPKDWKLCYDTYNRMLSTTSDTKRGYASCGRKRKIVKGVVSWLIGRMKVLRKQGLCTSKALQRELAQKKHIKVEASTVRRVLGANGYKWLPRVKKSRYTVEQRVKRVAFSDEVLEFTPKGFDKSVHMAMDGVVVTIPPQGAVARENYCHTDVTHTYRKPSERDLPELQGHDKYKKQVPPHRIVPLWGGIGAGGFAPIFFHKSRKTNEDDWSSMVEKGSLTKALQALSPDHKRGSWKIICDNESFLRAPASRAAHKQCKVRLWGIPAKSPDLNPIERFWSWMRRALNKMDLEDLIKKRPVPGRTAYQERVRRLLKSPRAQQVAKNMFRSLRKVAQDVKNKGGRASARG